jgi:regulator of protease activity HflC (stomatin/prohibitin superfamily)
MRSNDELQKELDKLIQKSYANSYPQMSRDQARSMRDAHYTVGHSFGKNPIPSESSRNERNYKKPSGGNKMINKGALGGIVLGIIIILALIITPLFVEKIDQGHVGVVYNPNGGVEKEVLTPGWHVVGLFKKVIEYPTRTQTTDAKNIELASSDGKGITIDFTYNFSIDATKVVGIFNKFGPIKVDDLKSGYIKSRLKNAARKEVSQYSVLELYGSKSSEIAVKIQDDFTKDVEDLGIQIEGLVLGRPHPDKATQAAIDATVKAKQELERKNTEVEIARKDAEKQLITAQGNADAAIATATGQAEANRLLEQSITPLLIELKLAEARKAHGWVEVLGSDSIITDTKK